jgi:hypothetical protein
MAPTEGRPKSRISWLLRQLSGTWPDLRIEVWYPYVRESTPATLEQARAKPEDLLCQADVKRDPRSFTVTLSRHMGQKRGRAEGSFVRETREQTVTFYRDLVQNMKAWQARPPQIRTEAPDVDDSDPPSPPDLLPLTPADRMLPRLTGEASNGETAEKFASIPSGGSLIQDSIQGSVLSKIDPTEPDPTPATTGNPTVPEPLWATS